MEPISELVEQSGGRETSLLALLQILYEIEQCEKERKALQLAKNQPPGKGSKDADKKKQRTKSPSKGKDASRKKSPDNGKTKMKKSKAVQELLNGAKGTRIVPMKDIQVKIDQPIEANAEGEFSLEELLEDLCFLLLNDPQIV